MSSNDNDKAVHTAASVRRTRWGVTPHVGTATRAETPLNYLNCPAPGFLNKPTIHGDATTAKVSTTTGWESATVDGAKDKDTPILMKVKCPPEVQTQQNAAIEVTQTLLQLKDSPVFETAA